MPESVVRTQKRQKLVTELEMSFQSTLGLFSNWGYVLLHKEFDRQPELRDRIFYILIYGLYDHGHLNQTRLTKLRAKCEELRSVSCSAFLDLLERFSEGVIDLLSIFDLDETIFLREMRNQMLHGNLSTWVAEKRSLPFAQERSVQIIQMTSEEWWERFRRYRAGRDQQQATGPLRARFMYHESLFWDLEATLRSDEFWPVIQAMLRDHDTQPSAPWVFENGNFWDTNEYRKKQGTLSSFSRSREYPPAGWNTDPYFPVRS